MFASIESGKPLKESVYEYVRGIAGGLLFSFPLLYTMEVWWAGFILPPKSLFILVVITFILLLGYNRYAGMHPDSTWIEVIIDSVEEMGLGIILSFLILLMLNRIELNISEINVLMGKVILEAMAVSIGVSIGTAQLGVDPEDEDRDDNEEDARPDDGNKVSVVVLGLCGAIIVGGNVAPTEEVLQIALGAKPVHIFIIALISIFLSVIIVYFSNLKGSSTQRSENFLYNLTFDTVICYCIALCASAFLLWFFDRFENLSFWHIISQTIILGLLASLGSSAGRLLIK